MNLIKRLSLVAFLLPFAAFGQTGSDPVPYATQWNRPIANTACANFNGWAARYVSNSTATIQARLATDGLALARARRAALADLIKTDPAQALALAVPASVRAQLPAAVVNELETRVSGLGDYSVLGAIAGKTGPAVVPIRRYVRLKGQTYSASVYGRRLGETTKFGIPLHGIVLDGVMAVAESALRPLDADETPGVVQPAADLRTAAQKTAQTGPVSAEMAGQMYYFGSAAQLQQAEVKLDSAEAGFNPYPAQSATNILDGLNQSAGVQPRANSPTQWTGGGKNILIIRINFSDLTNVPYSAAAIQSIADSQIAPYYWKSSFRQTSLTNTVTPVFTMPYTASFYATGDLNDQLHADAESAAMAASVDYDAANYDRVIVVFPSLGSLAGTKIDYGGLAEVGGPDVWCNGEFDFRVIAHELGHTYGLDHANLWQVDDGNPISPSGTDDEYGDDFDTMGANFDNSLATDFNPWFKNLLGWIADTQIQKVTTSGTYRIYAFDTGNDTAPAGEMMACKIAKDSTNNYWIGFHHNFTNNPSMGTGAYVFWGYNYNRQSDLLDMTTPGTDVSDAALPLGGIFTDPAALVTIHPIACGGTAPNQYLDVQISFGVAPPSVPMLTLAASNSAIFLGHNATFTVAASGNPEPAFQWQIQLAGSTNWANLQDGADVSGSQTVSLVFTPETLGAAGSLFRCIASNSAGSVTSAPPVSLAVNAPLVVSTLAGQTNFIGAADGLGTNATFGYPFGATLDAVGNLYIADFGEGSIRKVTPTGAVTTFARYFYGPQGLATDAAGNIYVADSYHQTIRKITPAGVVSTIAGVTSQSGNADGSGTSAMFNYPGAVALDDAANIYVADTKNNLIRRVSPPIGGGNWTVLTIAGKTNSGAADGVGTNAQFSGPLGIVVDHRTNIFVADTGNRRIRQLGLDATGTNWIVTTIAGNGYGSLDGVGTAASFSGPMGLALERSGNIYVTDNYAHTIRKMSYDPSLRNWVVSTIAGAASAPGAADGTGADARFFRPAGLAIDSSTNIYIADNYNDTIRVGRFASVVTPSLALTRSGNLVNLSWPIPTSPFALESATNLAVPIWLPVSGNPRIIAGQNVATNGAGANDMFFRLHKK